MNKPYESPYAAAMKGIRTKIAMQAIRKIIREDDVDENKLAAIVAVIHEYEDDQERAELEAERKAICGFMAEAGLSFGRFDFIRKDGVLNFLEVNPNGQWAWLDEKNEHGLLSAIAEEILAVERRGRTLAAARG